MTNGIHAAYVANAESMNYLKNINRNSIIKYIHVCQFVHCMHEQVYFVKAYIALNPNVNNC